MKEDQDKVNDFEIVFVSSDMNQQLFEEYFLESQPWLALNFSDKRQNKYDLTKYFNVSGVPTLVVLDGSDFRILNEDASVNEFVDLVSISSCNCK